MTDQDLQLIEDEIDAPWLSGGSSRSTDGSTYGDYIEYDNACAALWIPHPLIDMPFKFLRLNHPQGETFICPDKIAYVQRLDDVVFIQFDGGSKPIELRKEAAEAFLEVIRENSITIKSSK